ncbi:alpha/beta hydrolase [Hydrogenophaga sp.]|uniref:PHA/PHB synthase family protein n=1 Tax=Hydrogenophaga sp. TaxID=1904254 RepID=UPI0027166608|nr:alpha/beta fold hydrolase [Hydrogenophaga sp.]MDO8904087.1 alpha/beta fold hydrolase [Hydrogenophaga sp.]
MSTHTNTPHLHDAAAALDQLAHAALARASVGLSPVSLARAWTDWLLNLSVSPGSRARLRTEAQALGLAWLKETMSGAVFQLQPGLTDTAVADDVQPRDSDRGHPSGDARFAASAWNRWPWSAMASANQACERWWTSAAELRGMEPHSREQLQFFAKQWLDMVSPGNWLLSNPEALQKAMDSRGQSVLKGVGHAVDEWRLRHGLQPLHANDEVPAPGNGLAMTPGQVVLRNDLIELIQYQPVTEQVFAEPVLIIPSCIMKYYILDLSPHNSMVRWLTEQGHTVYIVSWRNPDENDALLTLDDYVRMGVLDALDHVHMATQRPVHLAGYCLGGTFASIAAATLARHETNDGGVPRLASLTLMAAETDFSEPGEMGVLIDTAQVEMLEDMMAEQGFLSGRQMAGSFQFLHSRELVWSQRTRSVLMGEPSYSNDLMAWNADVTRLPAVMHSQYLRRMYLGNNLAEGRHVFEGHLVSLRDIDVPMFTVGTVKDHVSPWRSVFKIHQLAATEVTFVLTNGGHNAGIVSEPGHAGRHYQILTTGQTDRRPTPDQWAAIAAHRQGSWWEAWSEWMQRRGSDEKIDARQPPAGPELGVAPGRYVMQRYAD